MSIKFLRTDHINYKDEYECRNQHEKEARLNNDGFYKIGYVHTQKWKKDDLRFVDTNYPMRTYDVYVSEDEDDCLDSRLRGNDPSPLFSKVVRDGNDNRGSGNDNRWAEEVSDD